MNVTVTLPEELEELVDYLQSKLSDGVYASSSELVGDALRLMQRVEATDADELEVLRTAYHLEGGDPQDADFGALKAEGRRRLASFED